MNYYVYLLDQTVTVINSIQTGSKFKLIMSIASLKKDDVVFVFIKNPIEEVRMKLIVTDDQTNNDCFFEKTYDIKPGVDMGSLPAHVVSDINTALIAGNDIIPITDSDAINIEKELSKKISFIPSAVTDVYKPTSSRAQYDGKELPYNLIIYGAPGTGKSHLGESIRVSSFNDRYKSVTFYDRYSYANFVGSYKPNMKNGQIEYSFVPGPFISLLESAVKDSDNNYLLVIEEINRAKAASVFGDLFQLLDRDENGISEYPVSASEELKRHLTEAYFGKSYVEGDESQLACFTEIKIPSNLYIIATMNSMDQGVLALDTAFKRRWEFEYLGVDDEEQVKVLLSNDYHIPMLLDRSKRYFVKWNDFRTSINSILLNLSPAVPEDRLLGPFFISKRELDSVNKNITNDDYLDGFIKRFESKVLMYLYSDLSKRPSDIFAKLSGNFMLSQVFKEFEENGVDLFNIIIDKETYNGSGWTKV